MSTTNVMDKTLHLTDVTFIQNQRSLILLSRSGCRAKLDLQIVVDTHYKTSPNDFFDIINCYLNKIQVIIIVEKKHYVPAV